MTWASIVRVVRSSCPFELIVPDPGADMSSCTGIGPRAGHWKSRDDRRAPVTSRRATGLTAASVIVALPSSKMVSRTVTAGLIASAVAGGAGAAPGGGAAAGAGAAGPAPAAGRGGANRVVIGRVPSGRRSMCTHDFFMCTRSMTAVAGQV